MPEVIYEVPDHYKNSVVGFYIFGWLFVGKVFSFQRFTRPPQDADVLAVMYGPYFQTPSFRPGTLGLPRGFQAPGRRCPEKPCDELVQLQPFLIKINFSLDLKTIKVSSTFAIDHFQLFGLRQGLKMGNKLKFSGQTKIVTRFHYSLVRHPLMTGLLIMFWFTPIMTIGQFTHRTSLS